MLNEVQQDRPGDARGYLCPSTVRAGDLVLIGGLMPAVAMDDYNSRTGGTNFRLAGTFRLPVHAATVVSPLTGSKVLQGDKVYAGGGTTDATTGVKTDLTLSKASGGVFIGTYDDIEPIEASDTEPLAPVKLKEGA
jgi:predicted RecA/RadA family phage recombinase